jgi:hypothetical protein
MKSQKSPKSRRRSNNPTANLSLSIPQNAFKTIKKSDKPKLAKLQNLIDKRLIKPKRISVFSKK